VSGLISNALAVAGFVLLTVGAGLVAPAAGFLVAGGCCVLVSRLVSA
jgi:flagellar biosynthesis component FlhA